MRIPPDRARSTDMLLTRDEDEFAASEQRSTQIATSRLIRELVLERDMLWAAVTCVLAEGGTVRSFCEDYGIDASLEKPTKLSILRHVHTEILQTRRQAYPKPRPPAVQTLPVSDIPLELTDL
jgi:hypothetical protein